jgi:hypothetical protein
MCVHKHKSYAGVIIIIVIQKGPTSLALKKYEQGRYAELVRVKQLDCLYPDIISA